MLNGLTQNLLVQQAAIIRQIWY